MPRIIDYPEFTTDKVMTGSERFVLDSNEETYSISFAEMSSRVIEMMPENQSISKKRVLTLNENQIFDNDNAVAFSNLREYILTDDVVIVSGEKVFSLLSSGASKVIFSTATTDENGYATVSHLTINSDDQISIANYILENKANKIDSITDDNKSDTKSYPSVKAIVDYISSNSGSTEGGGSGSETPTPTPGPVYTDNPLLGKKLLIYGTNLAYRYGAIIASRNSMVSKIHGGYTRPMSEEFGADSSIFEMLTYDAYTEDPDYVLIGGGIYDTIAVDDIAGNTDTKFGNVTPSTEFSGFNRKTSIGALEHAFKVILKNFTNAKVGVVLPHRAIWRRSPDSIQQDILFDRIIATCEKWGIQYLDIRKSSQAIMGITEMRSKYFPKPANATPEDPESTLSDEGLEKFYISQITNWMKNL